jgi:sugar phosphate isomerase/epimerase
MLKLSIGIAGENALPSAFVVFRGFEKHIPLIAELGYDGVELVLKNAFEINIDNLDLLLKASGLFISCISTGQVFAETGYMFTDSDKNRRNTLHKIYQDFINLASTHGKLVNIGRVRGNIESTNIEKFEERFIDLALELSEYAQAKDVTLILEPVNRYEINFINNLEEGVRLIKKINMPNMKLMPDVFHMNIEDATIGGELFKYKDYISYIHLADSNRLAPGWGHIDFEDIFGTLKLFNYSGWLSVEVLPKPDPYSAAKQAIDYLKPFINQYNK